jgi:hypothetical protein
MMELWQEDTMLVARQVTVRGYGVISVTRKPSNPKFGVSVSAATTRLLRIYCNR